MSFATVWLHLNIVLPKFRPQTEIKALINSLVKFSVSGKNFKLDSHQGGEGRRQASLIAVVFESLRSIAIYLRVLKSSSTPFHYTVISWNSRKLSFQHFHLGFFNETSLTRDKDEKRRLAALVRLSKTFVIKPPKL